MSKLQSFLKKVPKIHVFYAKSQLPHENQNAFSYVPSVQSKAFPSTSNSHLTPS